MTSSSKLTEDAERDVIDIYLYTLENFGQAQADKYVTGLFERFARIADNPASGKDFSHIHLHAKRCTRAAMRSTTEPRLPAS